MKRRLAGYIIPAIALAGLLPACVRAQPPVSAANAGPGPSIFADPGTPFTPVDPSRLVNANGSPRLGPDADYALFTRRIAPLLREWSADPRLRINPAYLAALFAKESGFEAAAISDVPANGYAQLTWIADADLREIADSAEDWRWMAEEVEVWPRHPAVHSEAAERSKTQALLERGEVHAGNDFFFEPVTSSRAATFWIRLLAEIWTTDEYPGRYGTFAREQLNDGGPLGDSQLFDLVTASYNQGYVYVHGLVERWGPAWTAHLNEEAADHLERIRDYTRLFQGR